MKKTEVTLIFTLMVVALLGFSYFRGLYIQKEVEIAEESKIALQIAREQSYFSNLNLLALSAIVYDPNIDKTIFALHEYRRRPLASVAKIMTARVALEKMQKEMIVTISPRDLLAEGDTGLLVGERWLLSDLIKLMLASSSNDAASAIATTYDGVQKGQFVTALNDLTKSLDLQETFFKNESGLDGDEVGAKSSARDIVHMTLEFYKKYGEIFESASHSEFILTSEDGFVHNIKNTNPLLTFYPNIKASKTGYTDLAGGNLVTIFEVRPGYNLIAVVLGSTYEGRFFDMEKLINASLKYFNDIQN